VLKPNFRGVRRHSIRFTPRGWQYQDQAGVDWLVDFNWPWRKNWTIRLQAHHFVLLSRSGETYLAQRVEPPVRKHTNKKLWRVKYLPLLAIPLVTGILLLWPTQNQTRSAAKIEPVNDSCESLLQNPDAAIDAWLANSDTGRIKLTQLEQFELGGIRQLTVVAECGAQQQKFKVQLAKQSQVWRLSKTSRLAN
jgi:hypothetical protein